MNKFEIDWNSVPHPRTFNLQELGLWALRNMIERPDVTRETIASELGVDERTVYRMLRKHGIKGKRIMKESKEPRENSRIDDVLKIYKRISRESRSNNNRRKEVRADRRNKV